MEMEEFHIDVNVALEEVGKIFGKNGKNRLKTLRNKEFIYSHLDDLKEDVAILSEKSVFDELLTQENEFTRSAEFFDLNNLNGEIILTEFGTIYARSNLTTVKAVHGVKNDAYQYEVLLGTNGPMHIGWASQNCVFTDYSGVGTTVNSFGFDGYHSLKSNMSNNLPYGQKWRVGNTIGCVIDLPKKTIEYFNNGRSLGKAFEILNKDDNMTYFPALSLYNQEYVTVNLGLRPLKFPVKGAEPIIASPAVLINYYKGLEQNVNSLIDSQISLQANTKKNGKHADRVIISDVIKKALFYQLVALLKVPYIVDCCFVLFLNHLSRKNSKKLKVLLELMWENIPEFEMVKILDHLMFCMLCDFKCTWRNKFDTSHQTIVLKLLTEICQETNTRKQMIVKILFDKIKFAQFLHIIAPSDEMFNHMVPDVYWTIENIDIPEEMNGKLLKNFPSDYKSRKLSYRNMCNKIKHLVNELEKLQILFLKTLLNDSDQTDTQVSSRMLFCRRYQSFTQENMIHWRNDPFLKLPGSVLLSTIFRMLFLIRELCNEELSKENDFKIDSNVFYFDDYNYFGTERVGGTFSYLKHKYREPLKSKLNRPEDQSLDENNENFSYVTDEESIIEIDSAVGLISVLTRIIGNAEDRNANARGVDTVLNRIFSFDNLPTNKMHVLSVLLNNTICLYHTAGHQQLIEYISFKDRLTELSMDYSLVDYELKTSNENRENLEENLVDLEKKISLSSRHMAWLMSMVFVDAKENILEWVLTVITNTIKYCSEVEEELFRFVPEFYFDNLLGLMVLLPDYTNITQQFDNIIIDRKWLAKLIGEILLKNFGDNRIVHPKSKDSIIQGIIIYLTHPKSVEVLQDISEISRLYVIESILKSTERNLWSKTNIILMLIWHGSGFAFRYMRPPHLENQQVAVRGTIEYAVFINMGIERPPAIVLQNDVRTVIANNKDIASNFINSSLNYLNWAFSEFISLFHEIRDIDGNVEFITSSEDINKLKVCGRSFILTVTLLRVIEMMINFDRRLIIDQEGSLGRVFQLICQILNRINSSTSTFQQIIATPLPYLESVHKFTILVAAVGVLLSMLEGEINEREDVVENSNSISSIPEITDVLISDPNFNLSSLDFLILPENENDEPFSLNSYENYLSKEELKRVAILYQHLDWYTKRHRSMASSINEEDLCMICYSNKNNVTIKPCRHQCCKLCINHHILYSRVCFYCKQRIESVVDINKSSTIIHDFGNKPPPL